MVSKSDSNSELQNLDGQQSILQLTALLNAAGDAIIGHTLDNEITYWNRAAQNLYGYSAEEMLGQNYTKIIAPERIAERAQINARVALGERVANWSSLHVTRYGREFEAVLFVCPVKNADGKVTSVWTVVHDATREKQTERALQQLQQHTADRAVVLETANRVALDILASRTGVEALKHIAEAARTLSRAQYAALGVARPDGVGLLEFVTTGLTEEQELRIGPRPQGRGLLGLLLERTEPLRVDVLAEHAASSGFPPNHPPMESFLGVPIRRGNTVMGSLYLTNKEGGGAFTEGDEIAVQALGSHAAVAIHNLHLLTRQKALLRGLILGQEEERRAVAYDLHDGLTQYVMASHAHFQTAWRFQKEGDQTRVSREMTLGMDYLQHAVVESRRLVNGLRSLTLDDLGLAGALEQLLQEEKARAGWTETQFVHNVDGIRFDVTLETTAYRVAQEALNNARKHARTSRIRLTLLSEQSSAGHEQLRLEMRDWGAGFVPEEKLRQTEHVGLHSMAERVSLIGGAYTLQSAPGEGTQVQAVFPALKPSADEFRG